MELLFIDDKFFKESGMKMYLIYTVDGQRSDWGFVQLALEGGESVHIRPATKTEVAALGKIIRLNEFPQDNEFPQEIGG